MNRRMIALLLAAVLVLALTGCAKKEYLEGKPKTDLLATTQPVYQLTCALTDGTGLSVGLLISESVSCLHDYTLTVSQMEMIEQSGLVLESGLGLENFMEDVLRGKTRIDISRNLDTLPGEDGADPHWWLDPMRYKQAAELAAQELGAQYPEFADQISENLAAFCEKLSSLQDYGEQALSDLSCRQLVTFHDGFSYFADAFSLTIAAAMEVESGSEPSAKELEEIISIVEENQIPAVFTEVNGETGAAEVVAHCGQIVALIGPNGAGKSTLIRSILGQRTYEGKITFHSADGKQTKLRIGYVPQSPAFDPADPISVLDLFTCCISRRPAFLRAGKALREQVQTCLARVHGESLMDKRVGTLSGGELQRVLLALALEPMPNMLILDEPLSGVDVEGMELLMDMLDEIRKTYDLSILMTTHDFSMLGRYADRVVLLREKILCKGTPLEVLNSDEFAQAFHLGGAK